jgi:hypothetical protein
MHDWYILGTLVKALSNSKIGTWFMVYMAYIWEHILIVVHLVEVFCMIDALAMVQVVIHVWCMVDALVDGR